MKKTSGKNSITMLKVTEKTSVLLEPTECKVGSELQELGDKSLVNKVKEFLL